MTNTPHGAADTIIVIADDLHEERPGFYRAFTTTADSDSMCPLFGYCTPGHTFRTIAAAARDARKARPNTPIYRLRDGNLYNLR